MGVDIIAQTRRFAKRTQATATAEVCPYRFNPSIHKGSSPTSDPR